MLTRRASLRAAKACRSAKNSGRLILLRIANASRTKEAPYISTLLIAVLGWLLVHTNERITNNPTISYSSEKYEIENKSTAHQEFVIINNSSRSSFHNLYIHFLSNGSSCGLNVVEDEAFGPYYLEIGNVSPDGGDCRAIQRISQLHAGARLRFVVSYETKEAPQIEFSLEPEPSGTLQNLHIVREGLVTFLARNELNFLLTLIVLWVALICGYVVLSHFASRWENAN